MSSSLSIFMLVASALAMYTPRESVLQTEAKLGENEVKDKAFVQSQAYGSTCGLTAPACKATPPVCTDCSAAIVSAKTTGMQVLVDGAMIDGHMESCTEMEQYDCLHPMADPLCPKTCQYFFEPQDNGCDHLVEDGGFEDGVVGSTPSWPWVTSAGILQVYGVYQGRGMLDYWKPNPNPNKGTIATATGYDGLPTQVLNIGGPGPVYKGVGQVLREGERIPPGKYKVSWQTYWTGRAPCGQYGPGCTTAADGYNIANFAPEVNSYRSYTKGSDGLDAGTKLDYPGANFGPKCDVATSLQSCRNPANPDGPYYYSPQLYQSWLQYPAANAKGTSNRWVNDSFTLDVPSTAGGGAGLIVQFNWNFYHPASNPGDFFLDNLAIAKID